ncbi:DUF4432 family protein [candidate division KSB1 bacterium]|nr:DUF4432 family protein [candidate division KSB1 bacterium]
MVKNAKIVEKMQRLFMAIALGFSPDLCYYILVNESKLFGVIMANLFGKEMDRQQVLDHVGDMTQLAGIRPVELTNGPENRVRALCVHTGSGLEFMVLPDRCLDIFECKFQGASLTWHSPAGAVSPVYYDPHDIGWLWSMPGGLMVTCGLTNVGPPDNDDNEELGLHGRISNVPARDVAYGGEWEHDEYILWISGEMREAKIFGPNLVLNRTIRCHMGESTLRIKDVVENQGYESTPLMILYHCNMGFPLLDDGTQLIGVINEVEARDREAEQGLDLFDEFVSPISHFNEQVFYIDQDTDDQGLVRVALVNRKFNMNQGLGVYLSYPKEEMPEYTEWRMLSKGTFVVGMEPGNCRPEGRSEARRRGALQMIEPGEKRSFHLEIGVLASNHEIRAFESKMRGLV